MRKKIREIMIERGLSFERLAEKVGTTPSQIHRLVNNERKMTPEWAKRLAEGLDTDPIVIAPELAEKLGYSEKSIKLAQKLEKIEQEKQGFEQELENLIAKYEKEEK